MAITSNNAIQVRYFIDHGLDLTEVMKCVQTRYKIVDATAIVKAAASYRDFLFVCWSHWSSHQGDSLAVISKLADEVWHCHIEEGDRYQDDCSKIFGDGVKLLHNKAGHPSQTEIQAAADAYVAAGLAAPPQADRQAECVWSIVG